MLDTRSAVNPVRSDGASLLNLSGESWGLVAEPGNHHTWGESAHLRRRDNFLARTRQLTR
jgi:hypothetical protein